jgi:hypothetical protein
MKVTKFSFLKTEELDFEHHKVMPYRDILIIILDWK